MVSTSSLFKLTVCPVVHRFLSVLFLVFISSVLCLSHSIWEGVKLGVGFHRPGTGPLRGNFEFERHSEVRGRLGLSARQRPLRLNGYFFSWMWRFSSRSPKFYLKRWKKNPRWSSSIEPWPVFFSFKLRLTQFCRIFFPSQEKKLTGKREIIHQLWLYSTNQEREKESRWQCYTRSEHSLPSFTEFYRAVLEHNKRLKPLPNLDLYLLQCFSKAQFPQRPLNPSEFQPVHPTGLASFAQNELPLKQYPGPFFSESPCPFRMHSRNWPNIYKLSYYRN